MTTPDLTAQVVDLGELRAGQTVRRLTRTERDAQRWFDAAGRIVHRRFPFATYQWPRHWTARFQIERGDGSGPRVWEAI